VNSQGLNVNSSAFVVNSSGEIVQGSIVSTFGNINIGSSTLTAGQINASAINLTNISEGNPRGLGSNEVIHGSNNSGSVDTDGWTNPSDGIDKSGFYRTNNSPASLLIHIEHATNTAYSLQIGKGYTNLETLHHRSQANGVWGSWLAIVDQNNVNTYAVGLTGSQSIAGEKTFNNTINMNPPFNHEGYFFTGGASANGDIAPVRRMRGRSGDSVVWETVEGAILGWSVGSSYDSSPPVYINSSNGNMYGNDFILI
jgi:hypothetical protein